MITDYARSGSEVGMDFVVICEHCGADVLSVPRIGDAEAASMRGHLQYCPSAAYERVRRVLPGGHGNFAELLHHFRIASADHPRV